MAYTLRGSLPFCEEPISKCLAKQLAEQLAQVPKELLKLIRSYLMIGWKEFIMAYMLRSHTEYLIPKLMGSNAKYVLIALQNYIQIHCIKMEHVKKHKAHEDYIHKLPMSKGGDMRYRERLLHNYHSSDNFHQYNDIRQCAYEVKRELLILMYKGYVVIDNVIRLESELTEAEYKMSPHPTYYEYWYT